MEKGISLYGNCLKGMVIGDFQISDFRLRIDNWGVLEIIATLHFVTSSNLETCNPITDPRIPIPGFQLPNFKFQTKYTHRDSNPKPPGP